MSEKLTKTWDEAQIRYAINYTLEKCVILWPLFNYRYKIQNKVIEWLETFDRDAKQLADSGYIESEIEERKTNLGFKIICDSSIPDNEIHFKDDNGKTILKIVNMETRK